MGEFVEKVLFNMENKIWRAKLVLETPLTDWPSSLSYGDFWYHSFQPANNLCLSSMALSPSLFLCFGFPFARLLGEGGITHLLFCSLAACSSAVLGPTALSSSLMLENSNSGKCFWQVISDSNPCLFSVSRRNQRVWTRMAPQHTYAQEVNLYQRSCPSLRNQQP